MKKILIVIVLLMVVIGCNDEEKWTFVVSGYVKGYEYIPAGWNQTAQTIIRFKKGGSCILYQHRSIPNQKYIYIYRRKGYFSGNGIIFSFKLTNKKDGYYIY